MQVVKPPSAQVEVIGSTDIDVIRVAYALAKASSEQAAKKVLRILPSASYPALVRHMRQHQYFRLTYWPQWRVPLIARRSQKLS
jgi:hypothetical protein